MRFEVALRGKKERYLIKKSCVWWSRRHFHVWFNATESVVKHNSVAIIRILWTVPEKRLEAVGNIKKNLFRNAAVPDTACMKHLFQRTVSFSDSTPISIKAPIGNQTD